MEDEAIGAATDTQVAARVREALASKYRLGLVPVTEFDVTMGLASPETASEHFRKVMSSSMKSAAKRKLGKRLIDAMNQYYELSSDDIHLIINCNHPDVAALATTCRGFSEEHAEALSKRRADSTRVAVRRWRKSQESKDAEARFEALPKQARIQHIIEHSWHVPEELRAFLDSLNDDELMEVLNAEPGLITSTRARFWDFERFLELDADAASAVIWRLSNEDEDIHREFVARHVQRHGTQPHKEGRLRKLVAWPRLYRHPDVMDMLRQDPRTKQLMLDRDQWGLPDNTWLRKTDRVGFPDGPLNSHGLATAGAELEFLEAVLHYAADEPDFFQDYAEELVSFEVIRRNYCLEEFEGATEFLDSKSILHDYPDVEPHHSPFQACPDPEDTLEKVRETFAGVIAYLRTIRNEDEWQQAKKRIQEQWGILENYNWISTCRGDYLACKTWLEGLSSDYAPSWDDRAYDAEAVNDWLQKLPERQLASRLQWLLRNSLLPKQSLEWLDAELIHKALHEGY